VILLDTQAVVWLVSRLERLSRPARRAIESEAPKAGVAIVSISLMELAQLAASGDIRIYGMPIEWLRRLLADARLSVRETTAETAAVAAYLPPSFPSDPFDRLITATAIVERIPLVTADSRIRRSGVVKTIW
jgi:PIN domain nuclease of toxin-antitoxin system